MNRILYIGNVLEDSGWGEFCRNQIKCLELSNIDVVVRPVILGKSKKFHGITHLLTKDTKGVDTIIQTVLPHHMMKNGNAKNIGNAIVETTDLELSNWPEYLNLMDEVWIPNLENIKEVESPLYTIPPPVDINKYNKKYPTINIDALKGRYIFYMMCEYSKRKNVYGALIAFLRAFTYDDMTALIIKVHHGGQSPEQLKDKLENDLLSIKEQSNLTHDNFPPVVFITEFLEEEKVLAFHNYGDCCIAPSFGEAINYVVLDACGFGNKVISTNVAGPTYMKCLGLNIELIDSMEQPAFGFDKHFLGYNTIMEKCRSINLIQLSNKMREIASSSKEKVFNDSIMKFSFENVGDSMIERIYSV